MIKTPCPQVVDATILETRGFGVMKDKALLSLLRQAAEKRGLILLTDSDGAGFVIRNYLKGAIPAGQLKQAYIPDMFGKERRKAAPGKEGKLGVEGMKPEVLLEALHRAGATFEGEENPEPRGRLPRRICTLWACQGDRTAAGSGWPSCGRCTCQSI